MRGAIVGMGVVAVFSLTVVCGARDRPALPGLDAPSEIRITEEGEPGTPLIVEGTVYAPDGESPAPGVVLYVYQTDVTGLYHRGPGGGRAPRLRGYVKTDGSGRYRYRTIRPGSYPDTTILAHIHTQLWGGGYEPQYNEDLNFGDDPFLADGDRRRSEAAGRFAWICAAKPDDAGTLRCTHNLRLKPHGDRIEGSIRHGLDDPPR
jgi:protocatechuate 3,4-dioxygenase beta subunit